MAVSRSRHPLINADTVQDRCMCAYCGLGFSDMAAIIQRNGNKYHTLCLKKLIKEEEAKNEFDDDIPTDIDDLLEEVIIDPEPEPLTPEEKDQKEILEWLGKLSCVTWQSIYDRLGEHVIGQDEAREKIATALYEHVIRILHRNEANTLPRANILMYGPTGCGKTEFFRTASEILNIPMAKQDATQLTGPGYKGLDLEDVISKMFNDNGRNIRKTEVGIVFLDEFDKLTNVHTQSNVGEYRLMIMNSVLKAIEGTTLYIPQIPGDKKSPTIPIDTSNMLFVLCGAHMELCKKKKQVSRGIGFGSEGYVETDEEEPLRPQDFIDYGYPPELIGRLPNIIKLKALDVPTTVRAMTEPKNSIINKYNNLANILHGRLVFDEGVLVAIAEKGISYGTGVRGATSVLEDILNDKIASLAKGEIVGKVGYNTSPQKLFYPFITEITVTMNDVHNAIGYVPNKDSETENNDFATA